MYSPYIVRKMHDTCSGPVSPSEQEGLNQCGGLSAVSGGAQDSAEEAKGPLWVEVGRV